MSDVDASFFVSPLDDRTRAVLKHIPVAACYVLATLAAAWISARSVRNATIRQALVWAFSACLIAIVAAFKLVRAGPILVEKIREAAKAHGWYEHHRSVQYVVLGALLIAAVLVTRHAWTRRHGLGPGTLLAGLSSLMLFIWVAIRASSLHIADEYMGVRLGSLTVGEVGELTFLVIVIACGLINGKPAR